MKEFKTYHPVVNIVYFIFVIGFTMFFMHPACLLISFISGFIYSVLLKGKRAIRENIVYMLPMLIFMAVMNPAFNHQGSTILMYLPGGNPLTFESVAYGFFSALMIVSVICWFSCYNQIMTEDKFIYLFGRIIPSMSLIVSMTLRFVPDFMEKFKETLNAQRLIGRDVFSGKVINRFKNLISVFSIMINWSMENAIETADSMKARGYGLKGRTSFSVFIFDKRDKWTLLWTLILGAYILLGTVMGKLSFNFFPSIKMPEVSLYEISLYTVYFVLCLLPIIIEVLEVKRWKAIK